MTSRTSRAAAAVLSRRGLLAAAGAFAGGCLLRPTLVEARASAYGIGEFFGTEGSRAVSLSPSGARIAILQQTGTEAEPAGFIDIVQADAPEGARVRHRLGALTVEAIEWGNDDRLLIRVAITGTTDGRAATGSNVRSEGIEYTSRRILSVDADTGTAVTMFQDQRERMRRSLDMGRVVDLLPNDPDHVLMTAWEHDGVLGLHRVDITTGAAERIERGVVGTFGWHTQGGVPVMRRDINSRGTVETVYVRASGATDWKLVRRTRVIDAPDFSWVGQTDRTGVVLVTARAGDEDVESVREMNLASLELGPPMNGRAGRDVEYGLKDSAGRYLGAAYYGDRLEYEFSEPALAAHHRALNRFFDNECDVHFTDVDTARNRFIAFVTGPREPGTWFFYDKTARAIVGVGQIQRLDPARLGNTEGLKVPTRDGATIEAYLTAPPGGAAGPLIVLPHGGPEMRDVSAWDRQVQVLAAQGWWVLRPNFRGSGGYGLDFARQGWTRWGERMQDDVEDAVAHAIALKGLDAGKVGIIGTSYGGYAALMGALKRPDLYKAAIGICGVYDLPDMLAWVEREDDSPDKPIYEFWTQRIGDRRTMGPALDAASPRRRAGEIACPVLLVHGVDDEIVPIIQSRRMRDAFRGAGKSVELIEVKDAGHSDWKESVEQDLLARYVALFRQAFA